MELKISKKHRSGHTLVVVRGEIDLYTAPLLRGELVDAVGDGGRTVVDMAHVEFCDSTGLSVLLSAMRRARERYGDLELAAVRPSVRRVLEVTGLDEVFTLHDSADLAVAATGTGATQ